MQAKSRIKTSTSPDTQDPDSLLEKQRLEQELLKARLEIEFQERLKAMSRLGANDIEELDNVTDIRVATLASNRYTVRMRRHCAEIRVRFFQLRAKFAEKHFAILRDQSKSNLKEGGLSLYVSKSTDDKLLAVYDEEEVSTLCYYVCFFSAHQPVAQRISL